MTHIPTELKRPLNLATVNALNRFLDSYDTTCPADRHLLRRIDSALEPLRHQMIQHATVNE